MNAARVNPLRIDHSHQADASPPAGSPRPVESPAQTDGFSQPEGFSEMTTPRNFVREHLIVIGYIATAPIAIGGWLWLLGRIALTIFVS